MQEYFRDAGVLDNKPEKKLDIIQGGMHLTKQSDQTCSDQILICT